MSPNTISNVITAVMPTFAITWLWLWVPIGRLLLPFHKKGDATNVSFATLNEIRILYDWTGIVYKRIIMPVFVTIYVINLLLIESVSFPRALNDARDMYFIMGMWLFVILTTGSGISLLIMIILPFSLGYFIGGQSVYSGCVGVILIMALTYVYYYHHTQTFRLTISKFQKTNKQYLNGDGINPIWARLKYYARRYFPFISAMILTYQIFSNSSLSGLFFTYIDTPTQEIIPIMISLFWYAMFSIDILIGGLFIYLQFDLFTFLGKLVRFQKNHPEFYIQDDIHSEPDKDVEELQPSPPLIAATDQLLNLAKVPVTGFIMALSFLTVDMLLTIMVIADLPSIPGLTSENIATLSTILKVPLIVFVFANSFLRLANLLGLNEATSINSRSLEIDRKRRENSEKSLGKLLYHILAIQENPQEYIDVSQNEYLLSLGEK